MYVTEMMHISRSTIYRRGSVRTVRKDRFSWIINIYSTYLHIRKFTFYGNSFLPLAMRKACGHISCTQLMTSTQFMTS